MSIQNVTIIGMGALGTMFGTEIQTKLGQDHVSFLMDKERFEKNSQKTYLVNGTPAGFRLITPDMASPADLIIVSTKATGLISALDTMERSVGPNTIIISAINGVRSEDILIDRFGSGHVIHAVAQGMDATFFDYELTFRQPGTFCLGIIDSSMQEKLDELTAFFDKIGFPYTLEADIKHRIWSKFMLNVGINQACMVYGTGYGGAQDRINKKRSEVEEFAGTVIRLADEHGFLVPTNEYLYRRIKEIEAEFA